MNNMAFENQTDAFAQFLKDLEDVDRLFEIHGEITKGVSGPFHRLEPLNKSIVVMTCAIWEAYVENVVEEAFEEMLRVWSSPEYLPEGLKYRIQTKFKEGGDFEALWKFAGTGWRDVARENVAQMCDGLNGGLNTPNSEQISHLFKICLGMRITSCWYWPKMSKNMAADKLDRLVRERGTFAHGGVPKETAKKSMCYSFRAHVEKLSRKTDVAVLNKVHAVRLSVEQASTATA